MTYGVGRACRESLFLLDVTMPLNAIDRALASNPSCATALYLAAQLHSVVGHSDKAAAYANRALRQGPFDLLAYEAYLALGNAAITEARYEEAASFYSRAVQSNPNNAQTICSMRWRWPWRGA
jgi:tetratricopeptide (TPR) repeat protein